MVKRRNAKEVAGVSPAHSSPPGTWIYPSGPDNLSPSGPRIPSNSGPFHLASPGRNLPRLFPLPPPLHHLHQLRNLNLSPHRHRPLTQWWLGLVTTHADYEPFPITWPILLHLTPNPLPSLKQTLNRNGVKPWPLKSMRWLVTKPDIEQTEYQRDIRNYKKDGTNFLNHDPPGKFQLLIYGFIICNFGWKN